MKSAPGLQNTSATAQPCPVCGETDTTVLDKMASTDLCRAYRAQLHVDVESEVPTPFIQLRRCSRCGMEYFDPLFGGSADFYSRLSSAQPYYSKTRWEFAQVAQMLDPKLRVLDIGCGDGFFLRQLPNLNKSGLEFNPKAASAARAAGLDVKVVPLQEFPENSADVVTLFHVLEHLTTPTEFLRETSRVLSPGGQLIISVPNNNAFIGRDIFHAANAPPHHPLRWREEAFRYLPQILPFELDGLKFEPLSKEYAFLYRRTLLTDSLRRLNLPVPLMKYNVWTQFVDKLANGFALAAERLGNGLPKSVPGFSLLAFYRHRK